MIKIINIKECFKNQIINTVQTQEGIVLYLCLDDICTILKRASMINNGQAMRLCPSSIKRVIRKNGREMWFIKLYDAHKLFSSIRKDNRLIHELCDEMEAWINELPQEAINVDTPNNSLTKVEPITFNYEDQPISFKSENGITYVNATQMAKAFSRNPREWLLLADTQRLRESLVENGKSQNLDDQILTTRGQQGATWIQKELAMAFSQWLSPQFRTWCDNQIEQLMLKGYAVLSNDDETNKYSFDPANPDHKLPMPQTLKDALQAMIAQQDVIERQHNQIESNKPKVDFYDDFIENREWFKTSLLAEELQTSVPLLNRFLAEQSITKFNPQKKQWLVFPSHSALQCQVPYLWTNKLGKTYGYGTTPRWTHAGREFIIELWHKHN